MIVLEQWERVVVDWINCLGILKKTIKNVQELQNGLFYRSFLKSLSWKPTHSCSSEEIVFKFLEDKYPSFKINKNDNTEHIYIATLLMMQTPQEEKFHYQMCNKLRDETQIRIKVFFETILPLEGNIIRETMQEVLLELEDNVSKNLKEKTPLKNFLNSPAYSAHSHKVMTERNREIKELRNRLDLEQFKNLDLQEDSRIFQSKINSLQEKIKEQSIEIKTLREEQLEPSTPQSTQKEDNLQCQNYKKYINRLESQLLKQQDEMDILEADKEGLKKKLTCLERQSGQYKKKVEKREESLDSLFKTNEIKDRELVELRMNNEELRAHIKEINKNCFTERSFEVDENALSSSVKRSLNISEVLSPVIEMQLQEAKEETAILHAQVDSLKEKLDIAKKDYINERELNSELERKVELLNKVEVELDNVQKELISSKSDIINLQTEQLSLIKQSENLQNALLSKEKDLSEIEQSNISLNTELSNSRKEIENFKELLDKQTAVYSSKLNDLHVQTKNQETEHLAQIDKLTEERDAFKFNMEQYNQNFKNILRTESRFIKVADSDLDNFTINNFIKYFETILYNGHTICASYDCDIEKLKTTIEETTKNLLNQQLTISTLEEQNKQHILEITNITRDKKQTDVLLDEQKEAIHKYLQEIEILKEDKKEKYILEENLHKLQSDFINQQSLMKSAMTYLKDVQHITKQLTLMKREIQQEFANYQKDIIHLICEEINNEYRTLHRENRKVKQEKEKLKHKFDNSEEQLSNAQTINVTLEQNLLNNGEIINTLEKKVKDLSNELDQSKQHVQELKQANRILEEQQISIRNEADKNLKHMESENAKISFDLQNVTDKLNLLQQEMYDTLKQVDLKNMEINQLSLDVSCLKSEKEHLIHLNKEMYEAKVKEIQSREEELISLRNKMEKLTHEARESEKKMKEIIINLQEVRSGQDAVLATQETALKEKHLHIEELQKEFDKFKEISNKQLTDEKSLQQGLQTTITELKTQIHNQNSNVDELQKKLEVMSTELESSKDHCQIIDASQAEIVNLCQELEHPTKHLNSTIMETCLDIDILCDNLHGSQYKCMNTDNKIENVLNIIKMTLDELRVSQKVILHLSCANNELNKTLAEQKVLLKISIKDKEEVCDLKNKVRELETVAEKRNEYLNSLVKNKESLKVSLQQVFILRDDLNMALISLKQKWDDTVNKFPSILHTESSVCDEFKQLQAKRIDFEDTLCNYRTNQLENIKFISDILWEKFLWTEKRLNDTYLCSIHEKECLDILTSIEEDQFSDEKIMLNTELEKNKTLYINILKSKEEIESFITLAESYENSLKSGEIITQSEIEKKLQVQINKLAKEKKDLQTKCDNMRSRNVKLERNIDDLRMEIKKVQSETVPDINSDELQSLQKDLNCLKEENQHLRAGKDESSKTAKQEFENQLKDVHTTYERKLEDMKLKMKAAYNEQITKLNDDQEKNVREKLHTQMELMCQKHREEINRYKAHVSELSSQLWSVGEKLLIEQQQKHETLENFKKLQTKYKNIEIDNQISATSNKTCKTNERDVLSENTRPQQAAQKVATITEGFERRHSVRSIQAMGNMFKTEDEEEVFDNIYLADMKKGNCLPTTDVNRLSVLQMRNSLCKPHLKSSYPAEMQFLPLTLTEEEIKTGSATEDIFNDSLSQSLLPEQKPKKKDRSQTSYKKPGPPTPSKNGGRLSLQGNELKSPSSRSLKDRNMDRRTTVTPRALRNLFTSKRQDEGTSTPKGRRLSNLFRKPR